MPDESPKEEVKSPDFVKADIERLRDFFLRGFARRMKYLYTNIAPRDDIYLLNNTSEKDFIFCEVGQCSGLVQLHDAHLRDVLAKIFTAINIPNHIQGVVHLLHIIRYMDTVQWTLEKINDLIILDNGSIVIERIVNDELKYIPLWRPVESYYLIDRLSSIMLNYLPTFIDDNPPFHDVPFEMKERISFVDIAEDELLNQKLIGYEHRACRIALITGYDALTLKPLIKKDKPHTSALRLWPIGPGCINYGSYFSNDDARIFMLRDNIYLFPRPRSVPKS